MGGSGLDDRPGDLRRLDLDAGELLVEQLPAHLALGDLSMQRGDPAAALEHYKVVAKAGGEYGKAAAAQVARIDLSSNPTAYIAHACSADANAKLVVSIRNDSQVIVSGVQVAVSYTDDYGQVHQRRYSVGGRVEPGEIARVNTGLGPYSASSGCPARVVAAEVED